MVRIDANLHGEIHQCLLGIGEVRAGLIAVIANIGDFFFRDAESFAQCFMLHYAILALISVVSWSAEFDVVNEARDEIVAMLSGAFGDGISGIEKDLKEA